MDEHSTRHASCTPRGAVDGLEAWVYRDARRPADGRAVARDLRARTAELARTPAGERRRREAIDALVACGSFEAAAADAGAPFTEHVARLTDALAETALGGRVPFPTPRDPPEAIPLRIAVPEGFAYYGLHPEDYARAADAMTVAPPVLVVGIRSIGATLSAMIAAALRRRGVDATRTTVRPTGPPYDRRLELGAFERRAVRARTIAVVDEGPGLSGSTFLAVAEALERAGAPRERILLVTSRPVAPERLCAPNAAARWTRFASVVAPSAGRAPRGGVDLSAGAWRRLRFGEEAEWPAAHRETERQKRLIEGRLYKFEGLGPPGDEVRARADALAARGVAPPPRDEGDGWVSYPWLSMNERPGIERLARYCALRPELCPAPCGLEDLVPMAEKNLALLTGAPLGLGRLEVVRPAIPDARMDPHEWLGDAKVDGAADGDGHTFPGPTDIAWDLAGAIVEHDLDRVARRALLDVYRAASGDDASRRIGAWLVAYTAFRGGRALMAHARAQQGTPEEARLAREIARYRAACEAAARELDQS